MGTPNQSPRTRNPGPALHDLTSPTSTISPHTGPILHQPTPSYASPTAFFNPDAYFDPNTPTTSSRHDSYDSNAFDFSSQGSVPSTSHSMQSFGEDQPVNGFYGYNQGSSSSFAFRASSEAPEQTTPPAVYHHDDDRTPVITDAQHPIHPSNLPSVSQSTPSASGNTSKPLLSPFRSFGHQGQQTQAQAIDPQQHFHHQTQHGQSQSYVQMPNMAVNDPNGFMNNTQQPQFYYAPVSAPNFSTTHPNPVFYPTNGMPPSGTYPGAPPGMAWPVYYPTAGFGQPAPLAANGPQPERSPASGTTSLARSASTNSSTRPKIKLTKEDKKTIVHLHRSDTSLRQEDIARMYKVDRSTISKIILSSSRWTQSPEDALLDPPPPRQPKIVGGRFPAVEERMGDWFDMQIALGGDIKDPVAREQAKRIAREVGLGERFKASAKWLEKFKERRKQAGKPNTSPSQQNFGGYYPFTAVPDNVPMSAPSVLATGGDPLSRSQSAITLSSSGSSSHEHTLLPSPAGMPQAVMMYNPSDPILTRAVPGHAGTTPQAARVRSQSSPQTLDGNHTMIATQTPSSGKAVRPSPLSLQRQNSYHGSSPSPRRPVPPSRANSSQGPFRRSRPGSLAASAFGITPLDGEGPCSPLQSPTTSTSSSVHSRQRSECLTPFTASMATMALAQDVPEMHSSSASSVASLPQPLAVPPHTPMTPITPANGPGHNSGVFPTLNPDVGDYSDLQPLQQQQHQSWAQYQQYQQPQLQYDASQLSPTDGSHQNFNRPGGIPGNMPLQGYASMPNKHYGSTGAYANFGSAGEFGQVYVPQLKAGQGYDAQSGQRWA